MFLYQLEVSHCLENYHLQEYHLRIHCSLQLVYRVCLQFSTDERLEEQAASELQLDSLVLLLATQVINTLQVVMNSKAGTADQSSCSQHDITQATPNSGNKIFRRQINRAKVSPYIEETDDRKNLYFF